MKITGIGYLKRADFCRISAALRQTHLWNWDFTAFYGLGKTTMDANLIRLTPLDKRRQRISRRLPTLNVMLGHHDMDNIIGTRPGHVATDTVAERVCLPDATSRSKGAAWHWRQTAV
jgi:hypothetical protein